MFALIAVVLYIIALFVLKHPAESIFSLWQFWLTLGLIAFALHFVFDYTVANGRLTRRQR